MPGHAAGGDLEMCGNGVWAGLRLCPAALFSQELILVVWGGRASLEQAGGRGDSSWCWY